MRGVKRRTVMNTFVLACDRLKYATGTGNNDILISN